MLASAKRVCVLASALILIPAVLLLQQAASSTPQDLPEVSLPMQDPLTGSALREAIGLSQEDTLTSLINNQEFQQLIAAAIDFTPNTDADLTPLVVAHRESQRQLVLALTWGENPESAYQQLGATRAALAGAAQPFLVQCQTILSADQLQLLQSVGQNMELDPDLRTLGLTLAQKESIVTAQRQRDAVLKNARYWHNKAKRDAANELFETTLQSILTDEQSAQLGEIRQLIEQQLPAIAAAEAAAFNGIDVISPPEEP